MRISGFTMVKNADKLFYPIKESILSILPIVDEYIIALGDCDEDDKTLELIQSIQSPKIKIINTTWDVKTYPKGSILAQQTDFAKSYCTGDWLFYLQADEVVHENDLEHILNTCKKCFNNENIEGLLFKYVHFWGDYHHAFTGNHAWYRNEIRIIRNRQDIHSWRDAQSFRIINNFSKEKYLTKTDTRKLNVVRANASIYHYGWVRPPKIMGKKVTRFINCYEETTKIISEINYGPVGRVPVFEGSNPKVMENRIKSFDWENDLNYTTSRKKNEPHHKHNHIKNRVLSIVENSFFKDGLFTFKNYKLI